MNEPKSGPDRNAGGFTSGVVQGLREGPLVFATPLIALWRLTASAIPSRVSAPQAMHHG